MAKIYIANKQDVDDLRKEVEKKVPTTRTVNGKALSEDIDLTAEDVGALASGGKPATAVTADKVAHQLSFTGASNVKFDGSIAQSVAIPAASSTVPKASGAANAGSETTFARGDHVHPAPTYTAVAAGTINTPGTPSVTAALSGNTVTLTFDHLKGDPGATGPAGPTGSAGAAGPNTVSASTTTNLTGLLKGDGKTVSAASAGTDYVAPSGSITGTAANVTGTVAVGHGGTGATTLAAGQAIIGNGTSAVTTRAITNLTAKGPITGYNTNLMTTNTLAFWNGAFDANGTSNLSNLGTVTKGTWNGTAVAVSYGGTGATTLPSGQALIGSGTGAVTGRAITNNTAVGTALTANTNLITANTLRYHTNRTTSVAAADTSYTTYMARGIAAGTALPSTVVNGAIYLVYDA